MTAQAFAASARMGSRHHCPRTSAVCFSGFGRGGLARQIPPSSYGAHKRHGRQSAFAVQPDGGLPLLQDGAVRINDIQVCNRSLPILDARQFCCPLGGTHRFIPHTGLLAQDTQA
jgi:hypothetical protein